MDHEEAAVQVRSRSTLWSLPLFYSSLNLDGFLNTFLNCTESCVGEKRVAQRTNVSGHITDYFSVLFEIWDQTASWMCWH